MKNKMLKRSHLSEKKCREIIQLFSEDLTATQVANITGVSRVTINNYLKLIRTHIAKYVEDQHPRHYNGGGIRSLVSLNGANGKERRIHQWRSRELAFDVDAAGNDKQRTQQHHERNVVD